jgi:RNA polymerase sigma-70 factor (ECF subfamily)
MTPANPLAWLLRVSQNHLIDQLRKQKRITLTGSQHPDIADQLTWDDAPSLEASISDDQLKLIFACCHPALSQEAQIILTLKLVAGFGNKEVATALLRNEEAIAKAHTRAKKKLQTVNIKFDTLIEVGLRSRLTIVLKIIYLIFSEGYKPYRGTEIINRDLCYEAIRLAILLDNNKFCQGNSTKALIALMCFHAARFDARVDVLGNLIDLEHQERTSWDRSLIAVGVQYLNQATGESNDPQDYVLQAFISYYHCIAESFKATDWKSILRLYDIQLVKQYSPIIALNRIIPFEKIHGIVKATQELADYAANPLAIKNALYYAIKAEFHYKQGQNSEAKKCYDKAIDLVENEVERNHLIKKRDGL